MVESTVSSTRNIDSQMVEEATRAVRGVKCQWGGRVPLTQRPPPPPAHLGVAQNTDRRWHPATRCAGVLRGQRGARDHQDRTK